MLISETYASKYVKAADLKGRTVRVTIASIASESMQEGTSKPVLYFKESDKGVVLNRTNATTLAMAFGDNTDNWIGAAIELFPMAVPFNGQMQQAIRVRVPPATDSFNAGPVFASQPAAQPDRIAPNAKQRAAQQPPAAAPQYDERNPPPVGSAAELDDPIPFAPEWR